MRISDLDLIQPTKYHGVKQSSIVEERTLTNCPSQPQNGMTQVKCANGCTILETSELTG